MQEILVWFLRWEDPWRRESLPTPVFWPREFHGLHSPWGCKELDTTELLSLHFHFTLLWTRSLNFSSSYIIFWARSKNHIWAFIFNYLTSHLILKNLFSVLLLLLLFCSFRLSPLMLNLLVLRIASKCSNSPVCWLFLD